MIKFKMLKTFLAILISGVVIKTIESRVIGKFKLGGANVCEKIINETRSYKVKTITRYSTTRKTDCMLFGWWSCNVKKTATRSKYVMKTLKVGSIVLSCCDKWKERWSETKSHYVCDQRNNSKVFDGNQTQLEGRNHIKYAVRLVDGVNASSEGRIEINYSGSWGTVCDDGWGIQESHVICRMLGHVRAIKKKYFGPGNTSQPIWLRGVSCNGSEQSMVECLLPPFKNHNCKHSQDVGIVCLSKGADNSS